MKNACAAPKSEGPVTVIVRCSLSPLVPWILSQEKESVGVAPYAPKARLSRSPAVTVHGPEVGASLKRSTSIVALWPTGMVTPFVTRLPLLGKGVNVTSSPRTGALWKKGRPTRSGEHGSWLAAA